MRDSGGGSGESPNGEWCLGLDVEASGSGRPAVPLASRELLKSNKLKGRSESSEMDEDCVGDEAVSAVPLASRELSKSAKLKGRLNSSDVNGDCVGDKAESSASD